MRHVVIGVPAHNEAPTIVALADALERGAALLGEVATAELVLAHQDGDDDTLDRFYGRRTQLPQQVLRCPPGTSGKGRNVKLLIEHAVAASADLLLVDGDMRDYSSCNVGRFVAAGYDHHCDHVLPLWCRPWGHANTTNHFAVPLVRATFGAQVRQPLAGHRFLSRGMLRQLDRTALPDDYGIDVALTMSVLDSGGHTEQVLMGHVDHDGRQLNSEVILVEVATALLTRISRAPVPDRADVVVPEHYAEQLRWPDDEPAPSTPPVDTSPAREAWLDAMAAAVRAVIAGADVGDVATSLIGPFVEHSENRRQDVRLSVVEAEAYVWDLGDDLAARLR